MKKSFLALGVRMLVCAFLLFPALTFAQGPNPTRYLTDANTGVEKALGTPTPLPVVVGNMISVLISVLGIIFIMLIVYAGYLYLTAAGDKEKINKAKTLLGQSVIGLVIILAAYSIAFFVTSQLGTITTQANPTPRAEPIRGPNP